MEDRKINAPEIRDDDLESVSGGTGHVTTVCPKCGSEVVSNSPPLNWTRPEPKRMCTWCDYKEW